MISYYDLALVPLSENDNNFPSDFRLYQNYPNPFNPVTTISFDINEPGFAEIRIYDIKGKEVTTALNRTNLQRGNHSVNFNAADLSSGVYFYRIIFNNGIKVTVDSRKMILIK